MYNCTGIGIALLFSFNLCNDVKLCCGTKGNHYVASLTMLLFKMASFKVSVVESYCWRIHECPPMNTFTFLFPHSHWRSRERWDIYFFPHTFLSLVLKFSAWCCMCVIKNGTNRICDFLLGLKFHLSKSFYT